jgi:hypothetical protein
VNTAQSAALKEVIDDLEWPGSNITITLSHAPPGVSFRGEGHGDLQVHFSHFLSVNKFFLSLPSLKNHLGLKLGTESLDIAHTEILSVSCRSGKCPLPLAHSDRTTSLFHGSTLVLDMFNCKSSSQQAYEENALQNLGFLQPRILKDSWRLPDWDTVVSYL